MYIRSYKTRHPRFFSVGTLEKIMTDDTEKPEVSDVMGEKVTARAQVLKRA